ncbi:MAG: serine/threonine protein kinase [Planctomycetes bacterium]|nr:serine/threonine protein kinase [Planctomycetota bacterium]
MNSGPCPKCGAEYAGISCPNCPPEAAAGDTRLRPGDRIRGLEILELIGTGGMGLVYKARQPSLDRVVALKILRPERAMIANFENRFEREAKILGALSHPNIVTIHDSAMEGEKCFVVLEYVEGTTLREVMPEKGMPPRQALRTLLQICDALDYAHGKGVVHRDIKPENVLIEKSGRVKIADFGLAKLAGVTRRSLMLTASDARMGTVHYMAPEQIESAQKVDHRADIYSLGVVAYEMFTGELPLGKFGLPSQKAPVSRALDAVLLRALEKDPAERTVSVAEFRSGLVKAMSATQKGPPTSETVVGPDARGRARARKPPVAWIVAGALLVVAVVLVAVRPWKSEGPKPRENPPADRTARPSAEAEIRSALGSAAAVDAATWKRIVESPESPPAPDAVASHSLTYVLFRQKPARDVEWRAGSFGPIRLAIERGERTTILQPEYIKEMQRPGQEPEVRGRCGFESPEFVGAVEFTAVLKEGKWVVTEFRCPKGGEVTTLQADGLWKASGLTAPASGPFVELAVLKGHTGKIHGLDVSPDGRLIVSAGVDETVRIWDLPGAKALESFAVHSGGAFAATFRPDGRELVSGGNDGAIRFRDAATWKETAVLQTEQGVANLEFSPDGALLVSTSDTHITVWDARTRRQLSNWAAHPQMLNSVAFSADGKTLVSGAIVEDPDAVKMWELPKGRALGALEMDGGCAELAFTPDGRYLVTVGTFVRRWDLATRKRLGAYAGHAEGAGSVAVSPDGKRMVTGGTTGELRLWDLETGEELQVLTGHAALVLGLVFTRDGATLVSCGDDRTVRIWGRRK